MNADKLADALCESNPSVDGNWNKDRDVYTSGIDVPGWYNRIECHGVNETQADELRDFVLTAIREKLSQPTQAAQPKTLALFTANQAQALLDAFGGSATTYALREYKEGECAALDDGSPSPAGLYIYDINCPEEGVIYLGDEDEDSEPRSEQAAWPVGYLVNRRPRLMSTKYVPAESMDVFKSTEMHRTDTVTPVYAAQPVGVPEYSVEMGEAAEKYHASFKYAHPLPARWSWWDLWKAMTSAIPQPPAQPSADAEDAERFRHVVKFNWIGAKTRCEHHIQDGDLVSARIGVDAARAAEGGGNAT